MSKTKIDIIQSLEVNAPRSAGEKSYDLEELEQVLYSLDPGGLLDWPTAIALLKKSSSPLSVLFSPSPGKPGPKQPFKRKDFVCIGRMISRKTKEQQISIRQACASVAASWPAFIPIPGAWVSSHHKQRRLEQLKESLYSWYRANRKTPEYQIMFDRNSDLHDVAKEVANDEATEWVLKLTDEDFKFLSA
jgi:hypothetical protein